MSAHVLRIFVSSPGDVGEERVIAERVVKRLQGTFGRSVPLQAIVWEHEPMRATSHPQEQLPRPSDCTIVVCILWSRLGTRLPPGISAQGKTGTEWEFEDAAASYRLKQTPDLLVYRKTKDPVSSLREDEATYEAKRKQLKALDAFLKRWFESEDGTFKSIFKTFDTPDGFENLLESDLRKIILERLKKLPEPERTWYKEPFLGLSYFDYEHAPIFFGRTRAIGAVKERLVQQAGRGCAFVMVFGMSGVGKSSLVRAGVLPTITQPGVIEGIGLWRWCVFRPSEAASAGDLADGLAVTLTAALPELTAAGVRIADLARQLREAPAEAVVSLKVGLHRAAEATAAAEKLIRLPETRLALVVDQLEELFSLERVDEHQRTAFAHALSVLAHSGVVWVLATMRSDFYARCAELPELSALKEGAGQFDLLPPTAAELQQIISYPAQVAGLRFGQNETGEQLDQVLQEVALRDPQALPLLEFTLAELYAHCVDDDKRTLTFDAYKTMGGMEGALAQYADEQFGQLPANVQAALPAVCRALVTVRYGEEEMVIAQAMPRAKFQTSPEQNALVEALINARLLVSDKGMVRLAHEKLLDHWMALKKCVADDREFLRIRARVSEDAARWQRDSSYRPHAGTARAYLAWESTASPSLTMDQKQFLKVLRVFVATRRLVARGAIAAIVMLAVGAIIAAGIAIIGWSRALTQARIAQQRQLAAHADAVMEEYPQRSLLLAVEALRVPIAGDPPVSAAEQSLRDALAKLGGRPIPIGWRYRFLHAIGVSPNSRWLVTAGSDKTAELCNLTDGDPATPVVLDGHEGTVQAVTFSVDSRLLATGSEDSTVRLWDLTTKEPGTASAVLRGHKGAVQALSISPDDRWLASGGLDGTVRLWDLTAKDPAAAPVVLRAHDRAVQTVAFAPNGRWLGTGGMDGIARLWDLTAKDPAAISIVLRGHDRAVRAMAFSPDGRRLATVGGDKTARLWDLRNYFKNGLSFAETREFSGFGAFLKQFLTAMNLTAAAPLLLRHEEAVMSVAFSPNGRRLATGSWDKTARLWDLTVKDPTAAPVVLHGHLGWVAGVAFSPDSLRLATSSWDKTARLWDLTASNPAATPLILRGHEGQVEAVIFSPDGRWLITGSGPDGRARLWDLSAGSLAAAPIVLRGHKEAVLGVSFSPDGRWLATGSQDQTARLWDLTAKDPATASIVLRGHKGAVGAVSFSPDGRRLATAGGEKLVGLWDLTAKDPAAAPLMLPGHESAVMAVAFSPDGFRLATASVDKTARLWDLAAKNPAAAPVVLPSHGNLAVAFSPDGRRLATDGEDNTVRLWNLTSADPTASPVVLRGHKEAVSAVKFSPDGRRLATGSWDKTARLWDLTAKDPAASPIVLRGHEYNIAAVAFSPDGRRLATGGWDKTARLWDLAAAVPADASVVLPGPKNAVYAVAFSSDGRRLATCGEDATVQLWDPRPEELISLAGVTAGRNLSHEEWEKYFPGQEYRKTFPGNPGPDDR